MLSFCHIPPVCTYLQNNGIANIEENESGCNNTNEVIDECQTISTQNEYFNNSVNVFPNPSGSMIHIDIGKYEKWKYQISDSAGQLLETGNLSKDKVIDISGLTNGIYLLEIINEKERAIHRIVKID